MTMAAKLGEPGSGSGFIPAAEIASLASLAPKLVPQRPPSRAHGRSPCPLGTLRRRRRPGHPAPVPGGPRQGAAGARSPRHSLAATGAPGAAVKRHFQPRSRLRLDGRPQRRVAAAPLFHLRSPDRRPRPRLPARAWVSIRPGWRSTASAAGRCSARRARRWGATTTRTHTSAPCITSTAMAADTPVVCGSGPTGLRTSWCPAWRWATADPSIPPMPFSAPGSTWRRGPAWSCCLPPASITRCWRTGARTTSAAPSAWTLPSPHPLAGPSSQPPELKQSISSTRQVLHSTPRVYCFSPEPAVWASALDHTYS